MPATLTSGLKPADAVDHLPHKTFDFQYKSDDETGEFELFGAIYGNVDRQGDIIEPGAWQNADEYLRDGWVALSHNQDALAVGMPLHADGAGEGVFLRGKWHSHQAAQDCRTVVRERMAAKKSVKCSIGYTVPIDGEWYEKKDGRTVRHITKLFIYEVSFVNLPANPAAEVVSAKALEGLNPDLEAAMAAEQGVIEALKNALGLSTKAGRKMSAATLEKCKSMHKSMCEAHDKCMTGNKMAGDGYKAMKGLLEEHAKFLKDFEGGKLATDDEGDEEEPNSDVEGDEADDRKALKEEDTDDAAPPKGKRRKEVDEQDETDDGKSKARKRSKDSPQEDEDEKAWSDALRLKLRREALSVQFANLNGGTHRE